MDKIRILIADDHPTFRDGLCRFIAEESDLEIVGKAINGEEAVRLAKELTPDVAILDVAMPKLNGIEAAKQIKAIYPGIAILMISAFKYESYMLASLRAGAAGYVIKTAPIGDIINSIRLVNTGEAVFDMKVVSNLLSRIATEEGRTKKGLARLQNRELEVLKLAAKGMSNSQIATELVISKRTVQTHMVNIFKKLEVGSRTEAVLHALREGWLIPDDLP
jgi:DNA-binding NarL/FixJ family response regulator